jgi:hypothetical protein
MNLSRCASSKTIQPTTFKNQRPSLFFFFPTEKEKKITEARKCRAERESISHQRKINNEEEERKAK